MFDFLIVKPIFNLLVFINAIIPGHSFGLSIIIFTIVVRLLMWPLIKRQLHHAKAMRLLQPDVKRIKKATKGNRQKESMMIMELYKEKQINPFASFGIILVQFPILIGLYFGLRKIVIDPQTIISFSYPALQQLSWMKEVAADINRFDISLFGIIDLKRAALNTGDGLYLPAMFLVIASSVSQYFQSKQLMPTDKNARKLRHILKSASNGQEADQAEVNAAVGRSTRLFIPVIIFIVTVNIASALSLYWLVSGLVAIIQQNRVLGKSEVELEALASDANKKEVLEGEIINRKSKKPTRRKKRSRK